MELRVSAQFTAFWAGVLCLLALPGTALACSCAPWDGERNFLNADLVFEGVAVETREELTAVDAYYGSGYNLITDFKVTRALKGEPKNIRRVRHENTTSCAQGFGPGSKFRIFAWRTVHGFATGFCSVQSLSSSRWKYPITSISRDEEQAAYQMKREEQFERFLEYYAEEVQKLAQESSDDLITTNNYVPYFERWRDRENLALAHARNAKAEPDEPFHPLLEGEAWMDARRYEDADAPLARSLKLIPNWPRAKAALAKASLAAKGILTKGVRDYSEIETGTLILDDKNLAGLIMTRSAYAQLSLQNAKARGLRFNNSSVYGLNATGADLRDAVLSRSGLEGSLFDDANLAGAKLERSNFRDASLNRARLRNVSATGATFSAAQMTGADLREANLTRARFDNATLEDADLTGAAYEDADFKGTRISCSTKLPDGFDITSATAIMVDPVCDGEPQIRDFSGKRLNLVVFDDIDLSGANFDKSHIQHTDFVGTTLRNASFREVTGVGHGYFMGADLTDADFSSSNDPGQFHGGYHHRNRGAVHPGANLTRTDFSGATLSTENFIGFDQWIWWAEKLETLELNENPFLIPDTSQAKFERATIDCTYRGGPDYSRDRAEMEERGYRRSDILEFQQRGLRSTLALAYEFKFLVNTKWQWPSVRFGEHCERYFKEADK